MPRILAPRALYALLPVLILALPAAASGAVAGHRPAAAAQADGVAHTLRQIPEACVRVQGQFTGDAQRPYLMEVVPTAARCPRRAHFAGLARQVPDAGQQWQRDERITVPSARCPGLQVELTLWRRDGAVAPPRDGQGRQRIYLEQVQQATAEATLAALPQWRASWKVQGQCP